MTLRVNSRTLRGRFGPGFRAGALIFAVAIAASIAGVSNDFVQDDLPIIRDNPATHDPTDYRTIFTEPYWPEGFQRDLFRPLTTWTLSLQWAVSDGSTRPFRILSYLLKALVSLAAFSLFLRVLPFSIAFAVALLFAAHPVHVESVAMAVNQAELWVALLTILMVRGYIDARRRGSLSTGDWLALGGFYLLACLFKEHAVIIPGLLLLTEYSGLIGQRPTQPDRTIWTGYAWLGCIGAGFLGMRSWVLNDFVGSFTAEALREQGIVGRTLTMLQVVPEWIRLLVWPARLLPDYSPSVILPAATWGPSQSLGVAILGGVLLLGWTMRTAAPTVLFGIAWFAVAIFPVSNILIPTGIVMAERTLFLPSVGAMLACGGVCQVLLGSPDAARDRRQALLCALCGLLIFLGIGRSASRHREMRTQETYWEHGIQDAPLSYRAWHAYADLQWAHGDKRSAIRSYNYALAMYPPAWWIRNDLAVRFQSEGECYPALELFAESLRLQPHQAGARAARIACLLRLGRYPEAAVEADSALAMGYSADRMTGLDTFEGLRATADSAHRVAAPPGTIDRIIRMTITRH